MKKEIGNWIVKLIVENKLGEGRMGEVYLAKHKVLSNLAAVKFIPSGLASNIDFSESFFEVIKRQARLKHPNIGQIMDYITEDNRSFLATKYSFLVMEYLERGTLADVIEKAKSPIEQTKALKWIKQVLSGLNYAHQKGVVHRDIKSTNIMLDEYENAKVVDFGLAPDFMSRLRQRVSEEIVRLGTVHYMSPEQIRSPKEVDHRTDVYSTAIVLYEMLTGRVPFDGDSEFDIREAQVKNEPLPLSQINPNIPKKLEEIVLKGLAKISNQRYFGCDEFLHAIEDYQMAELAKTTIAIYG